MWHYIEEDGAWHFILGLSSACGFFQVKKHPKPGRKPARENCCGKCWSEWKRRQANAAVPEGSTEGTGEGEPAPEN